nr:hypothetical protein [Abalone asfa-like virus]
MERLCDRLSADNKQTFVTLEYDITCSVKSNVVFPKKSTLATVEIAKHLTPGKEVINSYCGKPYETLNSKYQVYHKLRDFKSIKMGEALIYKPDPAVYEYDFDKSKNEVFLVCANTENRLDKGYSCVLTPENAYGILWASDPPLCFIGQYHNINRAYDAKDEFNAKYKGKEVKLKGIDFTVIGHNGALEIPKKEKGGFINPPGTSTIN